jgi:hypothetical protein
MKLMKFNGREFIRKVNGWYDTATDEFMGMTEMYDLVYETMEGDKV